MVQNLMLATQALGVGGHPFSGGKGRVTMRRRGAVARDRRRGPVRVRSASSSTGCPTTPRSAPAR